MLPFYFLSVTTNLIMGGILVLSAKDKEEFAIKYPLLNDPTFLLVLLIFSGISAVFKLLSPVAGNMPVIGDIIPALSGILGCIVLFDRWIKASGNQLTPPAFFALVRGEGGGRVGLLRSLASPIGLLLGCAIRGFAPHKALERLFLGRAAFMPQFIGKGA